jgi:hypothetical protein
MNLLIQTLCRKKHAAAFVALAVLVAMVPLQQVSAQAAPAQPQAAPAAQAAPPAQAAPSPLAPLERLVGKIWLGNITLKDGTKITTRYDYRWGINRKTIEYRATVLTNQQWQPFTQGVFWWHPVKGQMHYIEFGAGGGFSEGTVVSRDNALHFFWTTNGLSGAMSEYKDTVVFTGTDQWSTHPAQKTAEGWQSVMDLVTFRRVEPQPPAQPQGQ